MAQREERSGSTIIIIDGCDLVGKTTLAKKLEAKTGLVYQHLSRLPDAFDRYWGYLDRMGDGRVVYDRFHMSEVAYARMRGDETPLTPERYRLVDAQLRLRGCVTVVVTAEESLIRARWGRDEMYDLEQVVAVNRIFCDLLSTNKHGYGVVDCDTWLVCNDQHPYPDDRDVAYIVAKWQERQDMIHGVLAREHRALSS